MSEAEGYKRHVMEDTTNRPHLAGKLDTGPATASFAAANNRGHSELARELDDAKGKLAAVQEQLQQLHTEATENAKLLRQQLDESRSAESSARSDAARARAEAELYKHRSDQLQYDVDRLRSTAETYATQLAQHKSRTERYEELLAKVRRPV